MEKRNLTEQFMLIHEKPATRFNKNLKKVYEMLDKYGTEKEDVDKVFNRATLKERLEMVKLLKEGTETRDLFEIAKKELDRLFSTLDPQKYIDSFYGGTLGFVDDVCEKLDITDEATIDKLCDYFMDVLEPAYCKKHNIEFKD